MSYRITVRINDQRVWNPMSVAVEICMALNKNHSVELFFDNEAPSMSETELPEFFDTLTKFGIDLSRITVITGNLLESHPHVRIKKESTAMYELPEMQRLCDQLPKHKLIKKHFGMMVSRCTMPRLVLASHLYANYQQQTFQTFHWQHNNDYHRTHLELEPVIHEYGVNSVEFDEAVHLLKHSPLIKQPIQQYPILHPTDFQEACVWYPDFFVDLVCETWYTGDTFFLTEKFWRAVATRTPFIIHGPQWTLQRLKQLGFQTFDQWWDEGYGEDPVHHNIVEIKRVLHYLAQKDLHQLNLIYQQMQPVLDHNLQVFKNLRYEDFAHLEESHAQG
jgi:hypothetical protein